MGCLCPTLKIIEQDFLGSTKYENFEYFKNEKGRYTGPYIPESASQMLKMM